MVSKSAYIVFPSIEEYGKWCEEEGNDGKLKYQERHGMKVTYLEDFLRIVGRSNEM